MNASIAVIFVSAASAAGGTDGVRVVLPPSVPSAAPESSASAPTGTALVALGDAPEILAALARFAAAEKAAGHTVLRAGDLSRRLRGVPANCGPDGKPTGTPDPVDLAGASSYERTGQQLAPPRSRPLDAEPECYRAPDEDALERMLLDARKFETTFESAQAAALRHEVIAVFARTPQPTARLRRITGEAWLDLVSGHAADGNIQAAHEIALMAMSHFGDNPINTSRFSPDIQGIFRDATRALGEQAHADLRVRTPNHGMLFADGNELGLILKESNVRIPVGRYRVWLQSDSGEISLPYSCDLIQGSVDILLDPVLDRSLRFTTPAQVVCNSGDCEDLLARLRRRLNAERVIGVSKGAGGGLWAMVVDGRPSHGPVPIAEALPYAFGGRAPSPRELVASHPGFVTSAAVTVVAAIAATTLGLVSRSQFDEAAKQDISQIRRGELNDSARNYATAANVLLGVTGAAAIGAGVFLWIEW